LVSKSTKLGNIFRGNLRLRQNNFIFARENFFANWKISVLGIEAILSTKLGGGDRMDAAWMDLRKFRMFATEAKRHFFFESRARIFKL
jgi:hypothetical protein